MGDFDEGNVLVSFIVVTIKYPDLQKKITDGRKGLLGSHFQVIVHNTMEFDTVNHSSSVDIRRKINGCISAHLLASSLLSLFSPTQGLDLSKSISKLNKDDLLQTCL